MPNGLGECSQIEVGIILMLDIVVSHIGMAKAMHSDIVRQTDFLADFSVTLVCTGADTAAEREVGSSTDIFMFSADGIILFSDDTFGRLLFRTDIIFFRLSEFFSHTLLYNFRLLIILSAKHLQVLYSLLIQDNYTLTRFCFGCLCNLAVLRIDHVFINENRFAIFIVISPGKCQCFANTHTCVEDK